LWNQTTIWSDVADEANWSGNYHYRARAIARPDSVEQVQDAVRSADWVRALGTRHTFNDVADTTGELLVLADLPDRFELDEATRTVTVAAGMRYGDVAERLQASGWALGNLASLPHISVAGAVATGTHGSGNRNGSLATSVAGLELVDGSGELVALRRGHADFAGTVVALGALGIVTAITLDIEPTFDVRQSVYLDLPWRRVLEDFDAITGSAYSVSIFTDWRGDAVDQVWLKARAGDDDGPGVAPGDDLFGARAAAEPVHMLPGIPAVNCTQQLGIAGPWHERLPHFKLAFTPSNGEEIQSEYLMAREHAAAAIEAVRPLGALLAPVLQVAEIRTMAGDDLWLSGAFGRDTVGFHFTWRRDQAGVEAVLPALEDALAPFGARPHWGKVFVDRDRVVPGLYPRMPDFRRLVERYDPRGVFRNAYLERLFG
jgi:FAD/FMN-containing dehydrogenases